MKRISPTICRLCVRVIINKRSFEHFYVLGSYIKNGQNGVNIQGQGRISYKHTGICICQ